MPFPLRASRLEVAAWRALARHVAAAEEPCRGDGAEHERRCREARAKARALADVLAEGGKWPAGATVGEALELRRVID
jgi:hypothetical protein